MLIAVREQVLKVLETARQDKIIGAPLEARVQLSADSQIYPLLSEYSPNCRRCLSYRRSSCTISG